jgi:hypothetical protein
MSRICLPFIARNQLFTNPNPPMSYKNCRHKYSSYISLNHDLDNIRILQMLELAQFWDCLNRHSLWSNSLNTKLHTSSSVSNKVNDFDDWLTFCGHSDDEEGQCWTPNSQKWFAEEAASHSGCQWLPVPPSLSHIQLMHNPAKQLIA